MCGIAGALVFDGGSFGIDEGYITRMRDVMAHRGPDGAGSWISPDGCVGLGHRRLSIIDLSDSAAQPMSNEDGSLWLTYNGEIYNHAEIRAELERTGHHQWKTDHSDTEMILHAFEEWGIECLQRFRGMFAFGLWDARRKELWLVRDRIGIKPLYWSKHHGRIVFASEIKALLEDPQQPRAVNEQGLFDYFSFLTVPAPDTLFAGIKKLPPSTWMRISSDGSIREERYWDVWDHTDPMTNVPDEEIAERLLAELRTSVKLRKVSDVPVGVFLSGGIDSSTNAALFSEGEGGPVKTFSIGYDQEYSTYKNELHYARQMAETIGAEHHERILTQQDLLDFLPKMVWQQDEPIADPVCMPVYYVSKLARDHGVVVCQVGEGADELFWGYTHWKTKLRLMQYNDLPVPRFVKQAGVHVLRATGRQGRQEHDYLWRAARGRPVIQGYDANPQSSILSLLSPKLRDRYGQREPWEVIKPLWKEFKERAWDPGHLNWMSYLDLKIRLPELLLMRVDKMSMAVSLEGRVPFLDHKFVELAMSIPESVKTRHGTLKHILKLAVRGVIPDELIDRPKQGFGAPVFDWFQGELGDVARAELSEFCGATGYLDTAHVNALFNGHIGGENWPLLNVAQWWKEFIA